jgi:hypothetical protein
MNKYVWHIVPESVSLLTKLQYSELKTNGIMFFSAMKGEKKHQNGVSGADGKRVKVKRKYL